MTISITKVRKHMRTRHRIKDDESLQNNLEGNFLPSGANLLLR